jgi:chemotaxis protein methyltransferase CheR
MIDDQKFLERIFAHYGYDFRQYSSTMVSRQITHCMMRMNFSCPAELLQRMLDDSRIFTAFFGRLSISVSTMFRDPEVYKKLRKDVLPILATYPIIRIWSAGIAGGQEIYSLAILLHEAGLYHRSLIYATDFNPALVRQAKMGAFPLNNLGEFTKNYIESGGREEFSKYYTTTAQHATIIPELKNNLIFSTHNLAMDGVFNEFHLIVCRNVVIYFNETLTNQVLNLFNLSLAKRGFLWMGRKEQLQFYKSGRFYEKFGGRERIYRKV